MKTLKLSMILLLGRHSFKSDAPFHTYWNIFARFCIQRFLKLTVYSIGLHIMSFFASSIKQPRQYIQYFKSLQHSSCQIQYSTKQIQYGFHNIQTAKLLLVIIYDTVYTVQYCAAMVPKVCSSIQYLSHCGHWKMERSWRQKEAVVGYNNPSKKMD